MNATQGLRLHFITNLTVVSDRNGLLAPSSTMVALLKNAILEGGARRFLIDGFPRSVDNLDA